MIEKKLVRLSDIKPNESNPRNISSKNLELLRKSIKQFPEMLEARPIIVNKDMVILGGGI